MKILFSGEKLTRYESIMVTLQTIKIIIGAIGIGLVLYTQKFN